MSCIERLSQVFFFVGAVAGFAFSRVRNHDLLRSLGETLVGAVLGLVLYFAFISILALLSVLFHSIGNKTKFH